MNSKQRRSIWREYQTKIESLEFQYRVLSGNKPNRDATCNVPRYFSFLQRAVKARRELKTKTGSSKGWCGGDPFQNFLVDSPYEYQGGQRALQKDIILRSLLSIPLTSKADL